MTSARRARLTVGTIILVALAGCGDPLESAAPPPLRITVSGQVMSLAVGDTGTARVEVTGGTGTTRFQWSPIGNSGAVVLDPGSATSARVQYIAVRTGTARIGLVVVNGGQTVSDTSAVIVSVR